MTCLVCTRQARGFGLNDRRFRTGDARRYPRDWTFCSRRCQDVFYTRLAQWLATDPRHEEQLMVDPTEFEREAMRMCLKFFGEAAAEIGFDKPLGAYSEAEALKVIEAILTAWTEELAAQHQRAWAAPVRERRGS